MAGETFTAEEVSLLSEVVSMDDTLLAAAHATKLIEGTVVYPIESVNQLKIAFDRNADAGNFVRVGRCILSWERSERFLRNSRFPINDRKKLLSAIIVALEKGQIETLASDAEVLSRILTFEPPPSGFDPLTAPDHLLRKHGFPRRPDPNKEARLSKLWRKAFSRPINWIKAELAVDRVHARRDPLRATTATFDISGKWAGAILTPANLGFSEPATVVYGEWRVPVVVPPPNPPPQDLQIGFWVGLGGVKSNNSKEVVQAGTRAIAKGENVTYSAFMEWWSDKYKDPPLPITNFPVEPGQYVTFLVCTPQPNNALISMLNVTTGFATSVGITAPHEITSDGTSAEWIVEGDPPLLLDFYSVIFGNCSAGTQNYSFDLTHAVPSNIFASDGVTPLASAGIISPIAVGVVWDASGP